LLVSLSSPYVHDARSQEPKIYKEQAVWYRIWYAGCCTVLCEMFTFLCITYRVQERIWTHFVQWILILIS